MPIQSYSSSEDEDDFFDAEEGTGSVLTVMMDGFLEFSP